MKRSKNYYSAIFYIFYILLIYSCNSNSIDIFSEVYYTNDKIFGTDIGLELGVVNNSKDTLELPRVLYIYDKLDYNLNGGNYKLFKSDTISGYKYIDKSCLPIHLTFSPFFTFQLAPNDTLNYHIEFICYENIKNGVYKLDVKINNEYNLPEIHLLHENIKIYGSDCLGCEIIKHQKLKLH